MGSAAAVALCKSFTSAQVRLADSVRLEHQGSGIIDIFMAISRRQADRESIIHAIDIWFETWGGSLLLKVKLHSGVLRCHCNVSPSQSFVSQSNNCTVSSGCCTYHSRQSLIYDNCFQLLFFFLHHLRQVHSCLVELPQSSRVPIADGLMIHSTDSGIVLLLQRLSELWFAKPLVNTILLQWSCLIVNQTIWIIMAFRSHSPRTDLDVDVDGLVVIILRGRIYVFPEVENCIPYSIKIMQSSRFSSWWIIQEGWAAIFMDILPSRFTAPRLMRRMRRSLANLSTVSKRFNDIAFQYWISLQIIPPW